MCKQDLDLHFCTCDPADANPDTNKTAIHNKNSRSKRNRVSDEIYMQTQITWRLDRYLGEEDSGLMGRIMMPENQFTPTLTTDYFVDQLNEKNRFDFDYAPSEGDTLVLHQQYVHGTIKKRHRPSVYGYMSFLFTEGHWEEGMHSPFTSLTETMREGKVKMNPASPNKT